MCHAPIRYKGNPVRIANIVLAVVGTLSGLVRLCFKHFYEGSFGWDDYTIIVLLISYIPSAIMIDRGLVVSGLGRDIWTVPFDHITNFIRWLFIVEVLYFIQIALVKITLLFFFLRIFPRPLIRRLLFGTIWFTTVWAVVYFIIAFCQCQPVSFFWTSWDKERSGKCFNINAMAWSQAAISIVLDCWMLALPLYEIVQLKLSWQKKISVVIMFCVGTFFTVVSVLRLKTVVTFGLSTNPTWDQAEIIHWSNIECNVGIICACLPTFRVMLATSCPRFFGGSAGTGKLSSAQPYHANKYGQNMTIGGSGMASRNGGGGGQKSIGLESVIFRTQEFEIQHTNESDDAALVYMKETGGSASASRTNHAHTGRATTTTKVHSSQSSINDSIV